MESTTRRLQSFQLFPNESLCPLTMSRNGFFYTGINEECICYYCGLLIKEWSNGFDPHFLHFKASPNCQVFTRKRNSGRSGETSRSWLTSEEEEYDTPRCTKIKCCEGMICKRRLQF